VVKFVFSHSKLRKHSFFAMNFKTQGEQRPPAPLAPPSDAHGSRYLIEKQNVLEKNSSNLATLATGYNVGHASSN